MDVFRTIRIRMSEHAEHRLRSLERDAVAAELDAALRAHMRDKRKPLCLVSASSHTVFFHGSPADIVTAFAAAGEDVHPASVCLSVRAVRRSLRKHEPNEKPAKKRRRKEDQMAQATLLVS